VSSALDTLSAEEQSQLNQMQADDAASEPMVGFDAGPAPASDPVATQADPQPAQQTEEPKPTMVDKRALDEERARRRELEAKFQQQEVARAKLEERFNLLLDAAKAHSAQPAPTTPAAPPVPAPEFERDPAGFIKHGFETLGQRLAEMERSYQEKLQALEQGTTRLTQAQQQAQAAAQLDAWAAAQEAEYAKSVPDYREAMQHLMQTRTQTLHLMGITDPAQVQAQIAMDVRSLANMSRERGANFAETLYKLAGANGYRKADVAPATPAVPAQTAAPANAAERLVRGQEMATTLGATGAAPRGEPAPQALANMSDAEFAKYYEKVRGNPAALRDLLGA
jgi:hypothetical protein